MLHPIITQQKLNRIWFILCVVVLMQTVLIAIGLYACGRKVQVGAVNFNPPARVLTAEEAAALEDGQ